MSYNAKVYMEQGADELHVANTGRIRLDGAAVVEAETAAVTLASNAGTLSKRMGLITTEALTTAAGVAVTLTITNTLCAITDIIRVWRQGGTSDEGTEIFYAIPADGSFSILLENRHASSAFDGTFIFGFEIIKQAA